MRREWTRAEERELARLYEQGFTPTWLANYFKRTVRSINGKLNHMLVEPRTKYRAWTLPELRKAKAMRDSGMTLSAIGKELGRSGTSVRHALNKYYVEPERLAA